jgi:glycerol-3-phosphate dehydrogenase
VPLPGGDFAVDAFDELVTKLLAEFPFLSGFTARRLVRAYGTDSWKILAGADATEDLGEDFGAGLSAREVMWLMEKEYARTAEDVVWRRNKLGLRLSNDEIAALDDFMADKRQHLTADAAE